MSGVALNSNKIDALDVNAAQYASHYKSQRALSVLPVHAVFKATKYKGQKPLPADNTYVAVDGFLGHVEKQPDSHASRFLLTVDNISFLGNISTSPSNAASTSVLRSYTETSPTFSAASSTTSPSSRFKYHFGSTPASHSVDPVQHLHLHPPSLRRRKRALRPVLKK